MKIMMNYKILEDRPELTAEQVAEGLNFEIVKKNISAAKKIPGKATIITALTSVIIITGIFIYTKRPEPTSNKHASVIIDTLNKIIQKDSVTENITRPILKISVPKTEVLDTVKNISKNETREETKETISTIVPFEPLPNADSRYAIIITDSIYGPTNVSQGHGSLLEYKEKNPRYSEVNSAWFKFTIRRDTLLTFHIVPHLRTDDYDFILFKCPNDNCIRDIMTNRSKPERKCFSSNNVINCNTGLSNSKIDTTFENIYLDGIRQGQTYAPALKVKAGETYYLMVSTSMEQKQDPEGFTIYFYNYLPKNKANRYK